MSEKIAVLGLGYVGLPVAVALAKKFDRVIGFDISEKRIEALQNGHDWTDEISDDELAKSSLTYSNTAEDLSQATFFIVTVPTPIDNENRPNLDPISMSCKLIAPHIQKGAVIVFESTVYPGVTDDICAPLLEEISGLKRGVDFKLGYSPERINPGDKVNRLENITKIISAEDAESLERVKNVYGAIIEADLHIAPSIKVAEAAKVIENTQRDLNIALMNEISLIFDQMDIRTKDVLDAAGTKWNFLPFTPGLVGGHCIGVDPYYLTTAAERLGYRPEVILAGRRINDDMGPHVARKTIKLLLNNGRSVGDAKIGVLGLTFKENVPDLRNSKTPDIVNELKSYGVTAMVHDPLANAEEAMEEYGIELHSWEALQSLDVIILAVNHSFYIEQKENVMDRLKQDAILIDVKSSIEPSELRSDIIYWSL